MHKKGFTLIEILIVVSILSILAVATFASFSKQRAKAEDAKVKSYLSKLKVSFEDYYNDKNCYPPPDLFDGSDDCGSTALTPYLKNIQCDKNTGLPYAYEVDPTQTICPQWYKVYATFNSPDTDPEAIAQRSATGSTKGNYGVSSGNVSVSVYYNPASSPSPSSPPSNPNLYYCSSVGNCTNLPSNLTCDLFWAGDANCGGTNSSKCAVASTCH